MEKEHSKKQLVSVVVPVFNEEANLEEFYGRLNQAIPKEFDWELIWVDGGSTDNSREVMQRLCRQDKRIKAIILSKRFGHQIALTVGIDVAKGDCVITMDGDLQHPPDAIPKALQEWQKGYDIVLMVREEYSQMAGWRKICSRSFYTLINKIAKVDLIPGAADFRLMDKKVIHYFRQYKERDRFIRGIISDMGFTRTMLPYRETTRARGTSKYGLIRLIRLAFTGVTSFSAFPLRLSAYCGLVIAFLCFVYTVWMIYAKIAYGIPAGIPSIIVGVFFLGGVQLISIGILGEYLMSVFKEVKGRPLYCIKEIIEHDG